MNAKRTGWTHRWRTGLLAATLAVAALTPLGPSVLAHGTNAAASHRPTIVLVHGAWAGPAGWSQVAAALRWDGYRVVIPALGLSDASADVAIVESALDGIGGKKILVGHSYGGSVISQAAAGRTDVQALVYTAAFAPDEGESLVTLGAGYAPPAAFTPGHLVFEGPPPFGPTTIDPAYFRDDFAQDLSPWRASRLASQQTPTNLGLFFGLSGPVAWHTVPSWYAISGADRMIDPALQKFMAHRIGATTVTFDDASHAGGYTHYAARFVRLIEQAAKATAN
jgi:pimeloyl-ACP methyl ester carboxylesterase